MLRKGTFEKCANACKLLGAKGKGVMKCANACSWLLGGSSSKKKKKAKRQRLDRVRMGTAYAGACGGRRGHCGVRRR